MDVDNPDERFPATGGRIVGSLAIVLGVVLVVLVLVESRGTAWAGVAFGVLLAAIGWSVLLRPRVWIEGDRLVLRDILHTTRVPLAAIEAVAVQQVLVLRARDRRYASAAVGRSRRQVRRSHGLPSGSGTARTVDEVAAGGYGLYVEERIRARAEQARATQGGDDPDVPVERAWAWPEIAWLGLSALAWVLLLAF